MTTAISVLNRYNPCDEAVEWLGSRDPLTVWRECKRADWMLWALGNLGMRQERLASLACDCAETALEFTDDPDVWMMSLLTLHLTREWTEGREDLDTVRVATYATYARYTTDAAVWATDAAAYTYATYAHTARLSHQSRLADMLRAKVPESEVLALVSAREPLD